MMKTLRRWSTSIVASIDAMVCQVQNHEALVNAAIKEVHETAARAKVQIARVRADGAQMRKRLSEMRQEYEIWQERAVKVAGADQAKALECLRRKKRLAKQISSLEVEERGHSKHEKQLADDLVRIEERLNQLRHQRNMLRSRQTRAEALSALQGNDAVVLSEIDEILDRWEIKVTQYEMQGDCNSSSVDALASDFAGEEEDTALQLELNQLMAKSQHAQ
ncbi:MAG: hypothetical protein DCC75_09700 [Proteobacteria bacterium]|nr:MAG: hypothetical protein DCC75_09700 [Pseudomonadota bacterium]